MSRRRDETHALAPAIRARLGALADAAKGHDWGAPEVEALAELYNSIDAPGPWHTSTGWPQLQMRDMGGNADVDLFIAGCRRLARIVDFGAWDTMLTKGREPRFEGED